MAGVTYDAGVIAFQNFVPALIEPEPGQTVTEGTYDLIWNSITGAVNYQIQISPDNEFTSLLVNKSIENTAYTPSATEIVESGTYYWRVRSEDNHGRQSVWSSSYYDYDKFNITHQITASVVGDGGVVVPSGVVAVIDGEDFGVSISPESGYFIKDVIVDGESVGRVPEYTLTSVTEAHEIEVSFLPGFFVDSENESGTADGLNWDTAFPSIQAAINASDTSLESEIRVKAGTYYEFITVDRPVRMYGGFDGKETAFDQRDWISNLTIIEGNDSARCIDVEFDVQTAIDGFEIRGGSADFGGGIRFNDNYENKSTLKNCTLRSNQASSWGGAIFIVTTSPNIINCYMINNSASRGGAIFSYDGAKPNITNCTVVKNSGGAYDASYAEIEDTMTTISNCIFWGNGTSEIAAGRFANVTFSDVQVHAEDLFEIYPGQGNINQDPLLEDWLAYPKPFLLFGSPYIDRGTNVAPYLPAADIEGDLRIIDGDGDGEALADMGADEYVP